jgi:hypothetical protein
VDYFEVFFPLDCLPHDEELTAMTSTSGRQGHKARLVLTCCVFKFASDCGDDPVRPNADAVTGTVTNVRNGAPLAGVTIVAVNPASIAVVGAPAQSDRDGKAPARSEHDAHEVACVV